MLTVLLNERHTPACPSIKGLLVLKGGLAPMAQGLSRAELAGLFVVDSKERYRVENIIIYKNNY